jgi:hypothetical protein
MIELYKFFLLFIVFLFRLLYDITYLYKNCMVKYDKFSIIIISTVHSIITTILLCGWMFNIYLTNYIVIFFIFIFIGWEIFGDCILNIETHKICNKDVSHMYYWPINCISLTIINIVILLYIYKYINYFLSKKRC